MDTKIEVKGKDSLSEDIAARDEGEFFQEVVAMESNSDRVLLDNDCDTAIKTEIKSENPFPKHFINQIKTETVTRGNNWEIDMKTEIKEQTLVPDFCPQNEGEFLPESTDMKIKKCNTELEMHHKIEIKVEPWWLETVTPSVSDDLKDESFPPVKPSRLHAEAVSGYSLDESPLSCSEVSGRHASFCKENYLDCENLKSDVKEMLTVGEHVLSEQSGKCSEEGEIYMRPHTCGICGKGFSYLSHLKVHNLIHESKKQHQCKTCNKSFTQLSNLKTHNLIHDAKKAHKCKTCGKGFTQVSHLRTHNLIHEGKKPHQCKTCNKSFTHSSTLKTHNMIHEGKKPHQCKTCNKNFTRLSHLKRHNLIHEGKKPHQCKICEKSFRHLATLKTHNLIHEGKKPHQCKSCDKSFTHLSHLKTHNLIHEGKKPHQCKVCNKSFTRLGDLRKHDLIHAGKKSHQCQICEKSFTELSNLRRHNLIHGVKKPHLS